jgi:hypothetical protein
MLQEIGDEDKIYVLVEHEKVQMVICVGNLAALWNWHE